MNVDQVAARPGTYNDDDDELDEEWKTAIATDISNINSREHTQQLRHLTDSPMCTVRKPYCVAQSKEGILRTVMAPGACTDFNAPTNSFGAWSATGNEADPAAQPMSKPPRGIIAGPEDKLNDPGEELAHLDYSC